MQHKLISNAKLNLFLHVLGKSKQNYHELDSLVVFLDELYDEIFIEERVNLEDHKIKIVGPMADNLDGSNIISRVLTEFDSLIPDKKFHITLSKNIPISSGMGGGSSNAGEIIKFLVDTYCTNISEDQVARIALSIGADVPLFLHKKPLYFSGIGEKISMLSRFPSDIYALVVYPNKCISTAAIFNMSFANYSSGLCSREDFSSYAELMQYLCGNNTKNDLYTNAYKLFPELGEIIDSIGATHGCGLSRMTGSGSACFGIFNSRENLQSAANKIKQKFSGFSIFLSSIGGKNF